MLFNFKNRWNVGIWKKGHKCAICSEKRNYKALRTLRCKSIGASLSFTSILSDLYALNSKNCSKMENGKIGAFESTNSWFFFSKCFFLLLPHANQSNFQGKFGLNFYNYHDFHPEIRCAYTFATQCVTLNFLTFPADF